MADEVENKDPLQEQIDKARLIHEKTKGQGTEDALEPDQTKVKKVADEDPNKITVDRQYIQSLREEAKDYRKKVENLKDEVQSIQGVLKQNFGVESAQGLLEKLEQAKKAKEQEEETKLSKLELAEKRAAQKERELEEARMHFESRERDLLTSRNKMIIQHALISAAVEHDANPRQILRMLENEFEVDPNTLVPYYKAEDGKIPLNERVKIFLEDPDNWNLVHSKIPVGSGVEGGRGASGKPILSREELRKLRNENPDEYRRRNAEIMQAYMDKRVR